MLLADHPGLEAHPTARLTDVHYYGTGRVVVGEYARLDHGCILMGDVTIGKRVHFAPYCVLYGKAGITIGNYSGFGAFTAMHSESDDYAGGSMFGPCVPAEYQRTKVRAPIQIGSHVLGGTRVTILPGVVVGDGVSLGAHSLIKYNCQPWTIYAGTPARRLDMKKRSDYLSLCRQFESSLGHE